MVHERGEEISDVHEAEELRDGVGRGSSALRKVSLRWSVLGGSAEDARAREGTPRTRRASASVTGAERMFRRARRSRASPAVASVGMVTTAGRSWRNSLRYSPNVHRLRSARVPSKRSNTSRRKRESRGLRPRAGWDPRRGERAAAGSSTYRRCASGVGSSPSLTPCGVSSGTSVPSRRAQPSSAASRRRVVDMPRVSSFARGRAEGRVARDRAPPACGGLRREARDARPSRSSRPSVGPREYPHRRWSTLPHPPRERGPERHARRFPRT